MNTPSLFTLNNKVAVITGGSGILGGAIAQGYLDAGATVVVLGTSETKNKQKTEAMNGPAERKASFACDVTNEEQLTAVRSSIIERFGRIDILVNAAGGNRAGAIIAPGQNVFDMPIAEFSKVIELNLHGTVLPTLVFGRTMSEQKSGSIINISSMASVRSISRVMGYSASKAAVDNFTRWMAVELATKFGGGLRVNAIAPGFFLTVQNRGVMQNEDGSLSDRAKTIVSLTPFKRLGEPEELIGTAVWLASDASAFVTGVVVPVDGGFNAFSGV